MVSKDSVINLCDYSSSSDVICMDENPIEKVNQLLDDSRDTEGFDGTTPSLFEDDFSSPALPDPITLRALGILESNNVQTSPSYGLLQKRKDGMFQVTKNIQASVVNEVFEIPDYFPVLPSGYATLVHMGSMKYDIRSFIDQSSYSLNFKTERNTSVILNNVQEFVHRRTMRCSGIKCCSYSLERCSEPHLGPFDPEQRKDISKPISDISISSSMESLRLARQVYFFAQNNFPVHCKHEKNLLDAYWNQGHEQALLQNKQKRVPNWIFRVGKKISDPRKKSSKGLNSRGIEKVSSQLPDFIGCASYGKHGLHDPRGCSLVSIPKRLQNADPLLVNDLADKARRGVFPIDDRCNLSNMCPPISYSFTGDHCLQPVHEQEAPNIIRLPCKVEYHYIYKSKPGGYLEWVLVVGIGIHEHTWPLKKAPCSNVKRMVEELLVDNPELKCKEICQRVDRKFGVKAPLRSIQKMLEDFRNERFGHRQGLDSFISMCQTSIPINLTDYVICVSDQRKEDIQRHEKDQIGISILLCNEDLLKRSASRPRFGCDGTFGVVLSSNTGLKFELTTIIAKDDQTGRIYAVMRQLCTRKTTAARKHLFDSFISRIAVHGLQDPLKCSGSKRLTMSSDYETTFAFALGLSLSEYFGTGTAMCYIEAVCFGCDVHAKRAILEKCNAQNESELYHWAIGTRELHVRNDVDEALSIMSGLGGKWKTFSEWLISNKVAFELWFIGLKKSIATATLMSCGTQMLVNP